MASTSPVAIPNLLFTDKWRKKNSRKNVGFLIIVFISKDHKLNLKKKINICVRVFNMTFSNISVISWWSVLLVEETRLPKETTDLSQVTDKLHILCCIEHTSPSAEFKLTTLVVICTDCTGKFNYHTIMTSPKSRFVFFKGLNITTPSTL